MIPVDDIIRRWGMHGPFKYWCCDNPNNETLFHVFLRSYTTNKTWSYFACCIAISVVGQSLREVIVQRWNAKVKKDMGSYYNALESMIVWEL